MARGVYIQIIVVLIVLTNLALEGMDAGGGDHTKTPRKSILKLPRDGGSTSKHVQFKDKTEEKFIILYAGEMPVEASTQQHEKPLQSREERREKLSYLESCDLREVSFKGKDARIMVRGLKLTYPWVTLKGMPEDNELVDEFPPITYQELDDIDDIGWNKLIDALT